jgi:hypothetical protein
MRIRFVFLLFCGAVSAASAEGVDEGRALMVRAAEVAVVDQASAMERFLLLREAEGLVDAGALAVRLEAAARDVARYCEGREPRLCLLGQAEALGALAMQGDPVYGDAVATRDEVLEALALALVEVGELDRGKAVLAGIKDPWAKGRAEARAVSVLAARDDFVAALEIVAGITGSEHQLDALLAVSTHLARAERPSEAEEALVLADRLAHQFPKGTERRAGALALVALGYVELGEERSARRIGLKVEDAYWQAAILRALAVRRAEAGLLEEAVVTLGEITDRVEISEAWLGVVEGLVAAGKLGEAETLAVQIDRAGDRAIALSAVAAGYIALGDPASERLLAEAEAAALAEAKPWRRLQGLRSVALARVGGAPGFVAEVERIAALIVGIAGEERAIADALGEIGVALAKAGELAAAGRQFQGAEAAASRIGEPRELGEAFGELARDLASVGLVAEAERVALTLAEPKPRLRALRLAAVEAAKAGRGADVLRLAGLIRASGVDQAEVLETLERLARLLAEAGVFREAEEIAAGIEDALWRDKALSSVANAGAQSGGYVEAERVRRQIVDPGWQAMAAVSLVLALSSDK